MQIVSIISYPILQNPQSYYPVMQVYGVEIPTRCFVGGLPYSVSNTFCAHTHTHLELHTVHTYTHTYRVTYSVHTTVEKYPD